MVAAIIRSREKQLLFKELPYETQGSPEILFAVIWIRKYWPIVDRYK